MPLHKREEMAAPEEYLEEEDELEEDETESEDELDEAAEMMEDPAKTAKTKTPGDEKQHEDEGKYFSR